ncbi:hypothetical protein ACH5RR_032167 [Cinchona calisaya]|uniref:Uncharacterized protein n=1 Tax=Cinchona calisaya TaxID=153742 RepID=A0ABD2YLJ7_9GENT
MSREFIASPSPSASVVYPPRIPLKPRQRCTTLQTWNFSPESNHSSYFWELKFTKKGLERPSRCNTSTNPGGPPGPGENDSKSVLDAFFLGKALAESVNERIESVVGEFLSAVGRLQAEQQKQVQDFQEEVLERAKKAKERAAREAMEAQGLIPKSSAPSMPPATNGVASEITPSAVNSAIPESPVRSNTSDAPATTKPDLTNDDPL